MLLKSLLFQGHPLKHGFSTVLGGVSEGELTSLNLSFVCGDDPLCVLENRRRYFEALGSDYTKGVFCQQIHGNHVESVTLSHQGMGATSFKSGIPSCDGLMTGQVGLPINIFTADCVAALVYDPVNHAAAAFHAGWPGSAAGIVDKAVEGMTKSFGSKSDKLLVALGPSAAGCCYEVDERVVSQLADGLPEDYVRASSPGKYMVDLRTYNMSRLMRVGVLAGNIERVGGCSICTEQFFSHRRQRGKAGRMLATIELLPF